MSDMGWTLWAAIQTAISDIDYDFWAWTLERFGRATEIMDSPRFPTLLEDVAAG
jgi:hypothetical protein